VTVKIALPKGRLLETTSALLQAADWGLEDYDESMRNYRLQSRRFTDLQAKVFNERDIPVQVAIGNYDLGICGLDWVEELSIKFTSAALVRLRDLGYGEGILCLAASRSQPVLNLEELRVEPDLIRIASEYPNLAEHLALSQRLRRFSIFPLWGAAEAYPPESATLALLSCRTEQDVLDRGLVPVNVIQNNSALLIANRSSWEQKNLSEIVESIDRQLPLSVTNRKETAAKKPAGMGYEPWQADEDTVRIALPDGHQQAPTAKLLGNAGIRVEDYPSENGNRRPAADIEGVVIKVIRPQDMPLQVANGNFDLDMWDDGYPGTDPTDYQMWTFYYSGAPPEEGGWNVGRWANEDFDTWLDEAYTLDEDYRKEVFCEMAVILEEELPEILLWSAIEGHGVSKRLNNVFPSVNDPLTWNVADWTLTE